MTPFLQLILALSIIIAGAKAGGWLAVRLRQPAVLGELLAGLFLGPSVLNLVEWPFLTNPHLEETALQLAELGVICLMFLAGLEIDLSEMLRIGRVSTLAGTSGVLFPLTLGALAAWLFGYALDQGIYIGTILTATSVSISAQTLMELGRLRTREGMALLGAAVADDVLVILLLSVLTALAGGNGSALQIFLVVLQMIAYLVGATTIGYFLLPRLAQWIVRQPVSEGLASLVLVTTFLFAWSAEMLGGLAAITGAFLAGLAFGRSPLREEIARPLHAIAYALLVPIFFVSIGLRTDVRMLAGPALILGGVLALVAILSKVLGCGLGAYLGRFKLRESLRVGVGMVSRGEVGLIVATVEVQAGLIGPEVFAIMTLIVLITTLVTPLLLRWAFHGKEAGHG